MAGTTLGPMPPERADIDASKPIAPRNLTIRAARPSDWRLRLTAVAMALVFTGYAGDLASLGTAAAQPAPAPRERSIEIELADLKFSLPADHGNLRGVA